MNLATPDFSNQFRSIGMLIENQDTLAASREMKALRARSPVEKRMYGFLQAQIALRSGRIEESLRISAETCEEYGDHVSLSCNRAFGHYLLGHKVDHRRSLEKLERDYAASAAQLSSSSRYRTVVSIGKFLEEDGFIGRALALYQEALGATDLDQAPREHYSLAAQVLRLQADFDVREKSAHLYAMLASLKDKRTGAYWDIEIQHALFHAELSFVGPDAALARAKSVLKTKGLSDYDKRLFLFDGLESALRRKQDSKVFAKLIKTLKTPSDTYENSLCDFALPSRPAQTAAWTTDASISIAQTLRLIVTSLSETRDSSLKMELRRRMNLMLESLDPISRALWKRRAGLHLEVQSGFEFRLCARLDRLVCGEQEISIAGQETVKSLLMILAQCPLVSLEQVTLQLWKATYNESYYHRLRNLAQRINKSISKASGYKRVIVVTPKQVSCLSVIRIES